MQSQEMILLCFEIARVELNVSLRKFGLRAKSFQNLDNMFFARSTVFSGLRIWSYIDLELCALSL